MFFCPYFRHRYPSALDGGNDSNASTRSIEHVSIACIVDRRTNHAQTINRPAGQRARPPSRDPDPGSRATPPRPTRSRSRPRAMKPFPTDDFHVSEHRTRRRPRVSTSRRDATARARRDELSPASARRARATGRAAPITRRSRATSRGCASIVRSRPRVARRARARERSDNRRARATVRLTNANARARASETAKNGRDRAFAVEKRRVRKKIKIKRRVGDARARTWIRACASHTMEFTSRVVIRECVDSRTRAPARTRARARARPPFTSARERWCVRALARIDRRVARSRDIVRVGRRGRGRVDAARGGR